MEAADALAPAPKRSAGRRLAGLFHGRPRLQVGALLAGPVGWLVIGYLGSLAVLLIAAFWTVDPLSGEVDPRLQPRKLRNPRQRTRLPDDHLAHDRRRGRWSPSPTPCSPSRSPSTWQRSPAAAARRSSSSRCCCRSGRATWSRSTPGGRCSPAGRGRSTGRWRRSACTARATATTAVWLVMSYLWLPYMILPIYAGLERIPNSLISASEDLGASPFTTFRRVILPLAFPAVVAGSIFTFSLTLGDYITPELVSNDQFIGNVIFNNISQQPALRRGPRARPDRGDDRLPAGRPQARRLRARLAMRLSRRSTTHAAARRSGSASPSSTSR